MTYEPHYCRNDGSELDGLGSWSPATQDLLDTAQTETELRAIWEGLENDAKVDSHGGAEWLHALSHLQYRQAEQIERDRLMPQACNCGGEVPADGAEPDHLPTCPQRK